MRTLIAEEWMSLDGVAQAPGAADEDTSGGFAHGGWHLRYFDAGSHQWVLDGLTRAEAFLFGRRTYETFASHWPRASAEEQAVARPLNDKPKYVASTTLAGPLGWRNSTLLTGDAVDAVRALKRAGDGELHLIGSTRLAQTLIAHDLVDELRLMVDPVLLGGGKRIFPDGCVLRPLRLVDSRPTSTGALLLRYAAHRD
jgi:dihydrofolate reductase